MSQIELSCHVTRTPVLSRKSTTRMVRYLPLKTCREVMSRDFGVIWTLLTYSSNDLCAAFDFPHCSVQKGAALTFLFQSRLKDSFCDLKQLLLCTFPLQLQKLDGVFRDMLWISSCWQWVYSSQRCFKMKSKDISKKSASLVVPPAIKSPLRIPFTGILNVLVMGSGCICYVH